MKKIDTLECYIEDLGLIFSGKVWKRKDQTIKNVLYATVLSIDIDGKDKINLSQGNTYNFKFKIGSKEKKLTGSVYVLNHCLRSIIIVSVEGF